MNLSATAPIYQRIKNVVLQNIESGKWPPGQKLPSENEWASDLSVSRMTVNRALRELTQEGVITRVHGVGSFVSDKPRHASLIALQDIAEEVRQTGAQYSARHLIRRLESPSRMVLAEMELPDHTEVFHIKSIHYQDSEAIQLEDRYVNPALAPDFLDIDLQNTTSTRYLMNLFHPDEMEHIVDAVLPDKRTQGHLQIAANEPCLQLKRRTWKNSQIVTLVTMTYPGIRYSLSARYATDDFVLR